MSDNNNSVKRAEQRVREMNTVTRRYAEQGNRYMQNMANNMHSRQTRFETVDVRPEELSKPQKPPVCPPRGTQNAQKENPRKNVPQSVKNAEKSAENVHKSVPQNVTDSGLDGERLLLLAVIYLLMRENADIKLILALCYLIL